MWPNYWDLLVFILRTGGRIVARRDAGRFYVDFVPFSNRLRLFGSNWNWVDQGKIGFGADDREGEWQARVRTVAMRLMLTRCPQAL